MIVRGVIFDLDGTLADTLPICYTAFRQAFLPYTGRSYTNEEIAALFGPSEEGAIRKVVPDRAEECLQLFLKEYEQAHGECRAPFPGLLDALELIRSRGGRTAVVTGKGPHSAAISLRMIGLDGRFDILEAGSPEGGVKAEAIGRVLERWGDVSAAETAYVGDVASDVTAARKAGVLPLSAAWAATADLKALAAASPHALFEDVESFQQWLDQRLPAAK